MPGKKIRRTPLEKLERAWAKADAAERQLFLQRIGAEALAKSVATAVLPRGGSISTGRYLTEETIARIQAELEQRAMTLADLNRIVGLDAADRSLGRALYRKGCLRLVVMERLGVWLDGGNP